MNFKNLRGKRKKEIHRLLDFMKQANLKLEIMPEDFFGCSGGFFDDNTIFLPNNLTYTEFVMTAVHEIGHAISEKLNEVSKKQQKAYYSYPEKPGDYCPRKDAEIIRYIEARAIYYSVGVLEELKIRIPQEEVELDLLYTVLSLEVVLKAGDLTHEDIRYLHKESKKLLKNGITWDKLYLRFIK